MKSAREEFGPPQQTGTTLQQRMRDLEHSKIAEVTKAGQTLQQAGVRPEGQQSHLNLVKSDRPTDHSAHKDLAVKAGDRPALSPCDGRTQANTMAQIKDAGTALKQAGVTGGQTQSATKQFAPSHTPSVPAQSAGGRSR